MFRLVRAGAIALPLMFSGQVGAVEYMSADVLVQNITASRAVS
jgi:hypothetical protein